MIENGLFIGRFQPVHKGHIHALKTAANKVKRLYILMGSANVSRTIKNPWTYSERKNMLTEELLKEDVKNFIILPVNDYRYSDSQWVSDIHNLVNYYNIDTPTLFGHFKEGNDYLHWFPEWKFHNIISEYKINATEIRQKMLLNNDDKLPITVKEDFEFYQKERELFCNYPFPETLNFNCADTVLECNGHILLIKRKFAPGKGLWALPGGFKNANESFLECALRELIEETNINIPENNLHNSIVRYQLIDDPNRSFGIPRNTFAIYLKVTSNPDLKLPLIYANDDAETCKWFPIHEILNNMVLFDDHKDIITNSINLYPHPAHLIMEI